MAMGIVSTERTSDSLICSVILSLFLSQGCTISSAQPGRAFHSKAVTWQLVCWRAQVSLRSRHFRGCGGRRFASADRRVPLYSRPFPESEIPDRLSDFCQRESECARKDHFR